MAAVAAVSAAVKADAGAQANAAVSETVNAPRPQAGAADGALAVHLDGIAKRFGREMVLRDLRLEMAAGKIAVLKGSNGAGKTTLLRVLATRLRPTRGRGRVFGFDLQRQGDEVRRRIGLVSVLGGNYPVLTARENLRLAATLTGLPSHDLDAALAGVGLADVADTLVRTYSSGMKKRLGLARLLLLDPPLWLMDEPYAALDEDGKTLLDDVLAAARSRGRTVLMASHELERSARFADAVLEIKGGTLRRSPSP
jgi:heme exporter protein A